MTLKFTHCTFNGRGSRYDLFPFECAKLQILPFISAVQKQFIMVLDFTNCYFNLFYLTIKFKSFDFQTTCVLF